MAKDPVCGMGIDEKTALSTKLRDKIYYFCSKVCKWSFDSDSDRYLKGGSVKGAAIR